MLGVHAIETPSNAVGAVSIIRVIADDLTSIFTILKIKPIEVGQMRLASLLGLDDALIARFESGSLLLMPHGGIGITRAISRGLSELGIELATALDPMVQYPEAQDIHEARMLVALAKSPSPMAVDVLLDQPRRWRGISGSEDSQQQLADGSVLGRLLEPPVVVAVGRANIGKSSLVNALAGASVAMVSDQLGTTRDHVGVMLNLGGQIVRWVDCPGVDERVELGDDGDELALIEPVLRSAALVLHAIDYDDPIGTLDPRLIEMIGESTPMIRVGVRVDLGQPMVDIDCSCSSQTGEGIETLVTTLNHRLIPPETLSDPKPWRFWDS